MRRRARTYVALSMAALAVLAGAAMVAGLGPFTGSRAASDSTAGFVPAPPPAKPRADGVASRASARRPEHRKPGQPVDIARVEAALARLQATTEKYSREQLADEQRKMLEAKARFEAVKIAEPKTRKFTDSGGTHWIELQHESGEIRYQLDPDEPAGSEATP